VASPPALPNCATGDAGVTRCGSDEESCCTSLKVEGGTYYRTYDLTDSGAPDPPADGGPTNLAYPATIEGLRLDKYLVTVGRFRQFAHAWNVEGWRPDAGSGKHSHLNGGQGLAAAPMVEAGQSFEPGWVATDDSNVAPTDGNLACSATSSTWTTTPTAEDTKPINCVNWYEAYAFCIWDDGFLPSEAEWEFAASGGDQEREYPWGSASPGQDFNYAIYGCYYPSPSSACATSAADIAPVGTATAGAGLWGQLDLAGELFEWGLDQYAARYATPCVDCAELSGTSERVIRGGYFLDASGMLLPSVRESDRPTIRSDGFGVRCARAP
jgi:formylglycine-generating enzyme required for sulfatase activity